MYDIELLGFATELRYEITPVTSHMVLLSNSMIFFGLSLLLKRFGYVKRTHNLVQIVRVEKVTIALRLKCELSSVEQFINILSKFQTAIFTGSNSMESVTNGLVRYVRPDLLKICLCSQECLSGIVHKAAAFYFWYLPQK